ncbi:MAG: DoxX family protein [bacterium]|nr:DoxX family protein [bacterium]
MLSIFPQLFAYQLLALFVLRVILGLIFIGHGYSKLFKSFNATSTFFKSINLKPAKVWVWGVGITELLSGILMLLGFLTQIAAILILLIIAGALIKVKIKEKFLGGYEFDLLVLAAALVVLFSGAGIFAIDIPL